MQTGRLMAEIGDYNTQLNIFRKPPPLAPKQKKGSMTECVQKSTVQSNGVQASKSPFPEGCQNNHKRSMPPPRFSSIPQPEANATRSSTVSESVAHVYPTQSYTGDTMSLFSPSFSPPTRRACVSQALSLQQLVENYSQSLPIQIKILHGYSGQTSQLTISTGEYYNIHFVKHQEVVTLNDHVGFSYTIPLNSSLQFGLVQSDDASLQKEYENRIYEKVSDLLTLSSLPRVVCATKNIKGNDEKSSLSAEEILVIKRVFKPKLLGKKSLEVLSLKTQSVKILSSDCEGYFSVSPYRNKIYLLELVKCISNPFPCQAIMFVTSNSPATIQCISSSLISGTVVLTGHKCETSLIASSAECTEGEEENAGAKKVDIQESVVAIPVDERLQDVEVAIAETVDLRQQQKLYNKTRDLFENFDATRVPSFYEAPNDNVQITQSLLYTTTEKGSEQIGIQVDRPISAYAESFSQEDIEKPQNGQNSEEVLYESVHTSKNIYSSGLNFRHSPSDPAYASIRHYDKPTASALKHGKGEGNSSSLQSHQASETTTIAYDHPPLRPRLTTQEVQLNLKRSQSQEIIAQTDFASDYEAMQPISPLFRRFLSSTFLPGTQKTYEHFDEAVVASHTLQSNIGDFTKRLTHIERQMSDMMEMKNIMISLSQGMAALNSRMEQLQVKWEEHCRLRMPDNSSDQNIPSRGEKMGDENRQHLEKMDATQV